jgi:hypothetical protein
MMDTLFNKMAAQYAKDNHIGSTAPTARRYRVTVWAAVPLEEGENEDGTPDGVLYPQYTAKELEKYLLRLLRKAEPECDLEVLDYEDVEA